MVSHIIMGHTQASVLDDAAPLPRAFSIDRRHVRRYLTSMRTTVSSKGQIVLPAEIRAQDGIVPGQQFNIERIEAGEYLLKRQNPKRNEGLVELLLACPTKGWFQPLGHTETTDDILPPIFE
jgi:AbrB family looped-hinge helix DNA binding protein